MGFLDKARAAANDLAAKADTALAGSGLSGPAPAGGGDAERYFRDLGVLAYLEHTNRPGSAADHERVIAALRELDSRGVIRSFALHTAAPPAPGTAGAPVGQPAPPPAPGAAGEPDGHPAPPPAPAPAGVPGADPAPPATGPVPSVPEPQAPVAPREEQAAPPPPSWMTGNGEPRT